ncbi:hypothetical protein KRZ98_18385 [Sphingobium sp. AS12]|nr:hypothetical protein [Sphingobium sp. AS12]MBV2150207.1 hypothetical protein [Sphingobium sp. AS12]
MSIEVLRAIVLSELGLIEEELTQDQRIHIAIEIAIRLLSVPVVPAKGE